MPPSAPRRLFDNESDLDLTAIIVNYNTETLLRKAIDCLRGAASNYSIKIVVVDNASKDNSVALLKREFPDCHLILNPTNVGFGRANNQAIAKADSRYVLLLNTDAFVSQDTIDKTVAYMDAHPRCGILGVKLSDAEGALQPSARYFPTPWNLFLERTGLFRIFRNVRMVDDMSWDHNSVRQCDWVPGCFYLVRKQVVDEVGLFDPRYFLYYEEVDHCIAAKRAGWQVVFFPHTTVVHIGGESARLQAAVTRKGRQLQRFQTESELLYFRKNHGVLHVWSHVVLTTMANALLVIKHLCGKQSGLSLREGSRHIALVWDYLWKTRYGTRPTQ